MSSLFHDLICRKYQSMTEFRHQKKLLELFKKDSPKLFSTNTIAYQLNEYKQPPKIAMKNEDTVEFLKNEQQLIETQRDQILQHIVDSSNTEKGKLVCLKQREVSAFVPELKQFLTYQDMYRLVEKNFDKILDSLSKEIGIAVKGAKGEEYVNKSFELYKEKYTILKNIVLEAKDSQGNTSEVDNYIITDKGIIVCEVKNYGNDNNILHIAPDGQWSLLDLHTNRIIKVYDKSPVEQNMRHCLALERFLKQHLGQNMNVPIIPLVLIGNNKVVIQNHSSNAVLRASELYTFVEGLPSDINVDTKTQRTIESLLKQHDIGAQDFYVPKYSELTNQIMELLPIFDTQREQLYKVILKYDAMNKKDRVIERLITTILQALGYVAIFKIFHSTLDRTVFGGIYSLFAINPRLGKYSFIIIFLISCLLTN